MAEREGFEPSLPFVWSAKGRRVLNMQRILQHTHLIRRIVGVPESAGGGPLSYTDEGERPAIVGLRVAVLISLCAAKLVRT
jgi:hypothetical protein